ncbi:CrcB family protein [Rothia sp. LK2588]|uniref:CrcB family protein n=1 Tax=Rothia sp. LK2588 TaxID=3114369 RepID=UPI0034CFB7DD
MLTFIVGEFRVRRVGRSVYRKNVKLQEIPAGVLVAVGGGLGAALRYGLGLAVPASGADSTGGPWGAVGALAVAPPMVLTLLINVCGALILGFVLTLLPMLGDEDESFGGGVRRAVRLGVGTGVMGGFTTYSTFSMQSVQLFHQDAWGGFFVYALGTLLLGFLACWVGVVAAEKMGFHVKRQPQRGDFS